MKEAELKAEVHRLQKELDYATRHKIRCNLNIRITAPLKAEVKKRAVLEGISSGAFVREAIEALLMSRDRYGGVEVPPND